MSQELLEMLKKNVIEGRRTKEDEGLDENLAGTPGVIELTEQAIEQKIDTQKIIVEGLTAGMDVVGKKFSAKEFYVPDMLASAEAVGEAMEILKPYLEKSDAPRKGKFIIATVQKDIHDIGKNIVAILLKGGGYEVHDLGIDVPTETIVEAVKKEKPRFLGLSALLTTTMGFMGEVITALKDEGLKDDVKVLIGGAAISQEFAEEIGADAYCKDGFEAIRTLESFQSA